MDATAPKWLRERPIAHRGLHDPARDIPENSLAAFVAAAARGFPAELDVRVTADGVAVVMHDASLQRTTGVARNVSSLDGGAFRALRLGSTGQPVPPLADVLDAVAGRVPLLIEIKNEGAARDVEAATLAALEGYAGEVAVQSFNPITLQWFARRAPRIPRGLLSGDFRDASISPVLKRRLRDLETLDVAEPHFIGYDVRCLPHERLAALRESGMPVLGWTVTSAAAEAAARVHCDNVIFEGYLPGA
jgi:glycerophosphoryl diester phosphodiesterase